MIIHISSVVENVKNVYKNKEWFLGVSRTTFVKSENLIFLYIKEEPLMTKEEYESLSQFEFKVIPIVVSESSEKYCEL